MFPLILFSCFCGKLAFLLFSCFLWLWFTFSLFLFLLLEWKFSSSNFSLALLLSSLLLLFRATGWISFNRVLDRSFGDKLASRRTINIEWSKLSIIAFFPSSSFLLRPFTAAGASPPFSLNFRFFLAAVFLINLSFNVGVALNRVLYRALWDKLTSGSTVDIERCIMPQIIFPNRSFPLLSPSLSPFIFLIGFYFLLLLLLLSLAFPLVFLSALLSSLFFS